MLTSRTLADEIIDNLSWLTAHVHLSNGQGKTDINHDAEDFYCGLLNILFSDNPHHGFENTDINLRNMNEVKQDYPAIDLGDDTKHLSVQVTSSEHRGKIRSTLEKFFRYQLDSKYTRLIILMIGVKDEYSKAFAVERGFDFDVDRDVWDTSRLGAEIKKLPQHRQKMLADYLESQMDIHHTSKTSVTPHLHLPPVSALGKDSFVGRKKELEDIQSLIDNGEKLIVLSGLGGMGKTELAVRFGQDYKDGAVYFIRFEDSFTHTVAKMASGIRPALSQDELSCPDEDLCAAVMEILDSCGERDILIIDNVDADEGSLNDLMKDSAYKSLSALKLRLILTTRFDRDRAVGVRPMPNKTLYGIFEKHSVSLEETQMDALIDAVNGHTLTIDLMARTLNGKGWRKVTAEMMLDAIRNNTLPSEKYRKIATDYSQSPDQAQIYQHLSVVFDAKHIPKDAKNVLRCATLLPADGMNGEYFHEALSEAEQDAFETLIDHGWLNAKDGLVTIHPVIRLVCREELNPSDETCGNFLNALWGQLDRDEYDRVKFAQLAELFAQAADHLEDAEAEWLNYSGRLYGDLAQHQKAKELYEKHLPALEKRLPAHLSLATAYNNVGLTYDALGDPKKALEYQLKALAIREKALPPDHPDLATSYNNVGCTYDDLGDHQKALEYQLKALAIREKVLPPDHPDLATSYNNVGSTYYALGDHQKALEHLLKALAIREKVLPPDHPDLAISYNNVGMTYGALGNHQKALEYQLKALAIREKALPQEHPDLATAYNNVGSTYGDLGDHQKALEYLLKDLAICEKVLPQDHPDLATSYNNVGTTYGDLGDHRKELEYQLKALAIKEKVLPEGHPSLVTSYNNVGYTYMQLGRFSESLELNRKAMTIREKSLPEGHPDTENSRQGVALLEMLVKLSEMGIDPQELLKHLQ